ncbi:MAG: GDP-L-fucose synthase family protein [Mycobacteriales bacterium]
MSAGPMYIAGHRGLVGSAIWREAESRSVNLVGKSHAELDLTIKPDVDAYVSTVKPSAVIIAAARVGGILANATYPAEFIYDNLQVQLNLLNASVQNRVAKVLFLGSSCIYPKFASQPISEDSLMTGPLEPTNDAYAIAKIAGVLHVQAIRRQYQLPYISAMPTNLFGPGDNFDLETSHVMPAMIRKMHEAKVRDDPTVPMWGTGEPRREFLHVDDMAKAALFLLEAYDEPGPINVGTGEDVSIRELAEMVQFVVGYEGTLTWDTSKPDGTPRKLLDTGKINALGWKPTINLEDGLRSTYEWYLRHADTDARL